MAGKPMNLAPIEAQHERIAADFAAHQEALVRAVADPQAATAARLRWSELDARLRAHIRFEDAQLLPLFAELVQPAPRGCSAELLLAEHRKLERLLEQCARAVDEHLSDRASDPVSLLALIETERSLREVLEHHDQRERAAFFPALAAALGPARCAELVDASQDAHPAA